MTQKEYSPNFNDRRVVDRCKKALAFIHAFVSSTKETPVPQSMIIEHLGQPQNKLSAYLKDTLLVCTNNWYSIELKIAKKYVRRDAGVKHILDKLCLTTSVSIPVTNQEDYSLEDAIALIEKQYENELKTLKQGTAQYTIKSDRYFFNIQNIRREVKKLVLARHDFVHQYDIECCAPTLLYQLAQRNGLDEYLHGISRYLKDRTGCREEISAASGLSNQHVKQIINSLFSGAYLGANKQWDIFKGIDFNYELMHIIQNIPLIKLLQSDISKMWAVLSKTVMSRSVINNTVTGKSRLARVTSKQKWNLYFRLERQVLDSVIGYLKSTNNKCFTEHDGWSTINLIDQVSLKDHVRLDTGFKINLDYEYVNPEKTTEMKETQGGTSQIVYYTKNSLGLHSETVLKYNQQHNFKDKLSCTKQNLSDISTTSMRLTH